MQTPTFTDFLLILAQVHEFSPNNHFKYCDFMHFVQKNMSSGIQMFTLGVMREKNPVLRHALSWKIVMCACYFFPLKTGSSKKATNF